MNELDRIESLKKEITEYAPLAKFSPMAKHALLVLFDTVCLLESMEKRLQEIEQKILVNKPDKKE